MSPDICHWKVRVRVPATTSNLGPGFDVLGMALALYNELEVELLSEPGDLRVEIEGEGADSLPRDKTNLVVKTFLDGFAPGLAARFRMVNRVPLARGLGSSAAARLSALLAAQAITAESPRTEEESVLAPAIALEGHPDNVLAAYHGGICAGLQEGERTHLYRLSVPTDLAAVVCVPDFELSTEKARAVLPAKVPRADAVANSARLAFLIGAIERRKYAWLRFAMEDSLHQPYRKILVPGMGRVIRSALKAGAWGAALSGAGPSILALAPRGARAAKIGRAMEKAFADVGRRSRALALDIDRKGATAEVLS